MRNNNWKRMKKQLRNKRVAVGEIKLYVIKWLNLNKLLYKLSNK